MDRTMHTLNRRQFMKFSLATAAFVAAGPDVRAWASSAEELPFASAKEAARAIRAKEVSSQELTRYLLERIERLNGRINAIVTVTADEAMARAKEADEALARGEWWGPFHGVPATIKDTFETAGVHTTSGSPDLAAYIPEHDAPIVARLKRAGAISLGKTNVPLFAADMQTYNEVFGTTNNPWDIKKTSGGSTGGGAAALAAGLGYLTLGSDIGGSIRNPAHFCGVYGHKPSYGALPESGEIVSLPEAMPYPPSYLSVTGPLARNAGDLLDMMNVLGGPEPELGTAYGWRMPQPRGTRLRDFRVGFVLDHPACPVLPEVREKLEATIDALQGAGVKVEEGWPVSVDPVAQFDTYFYLLMAAFMEPLTGQQREQLRALSDQASGGILGMRAKAWTDDHTGFKEKRRQQLIDQRIWADYFRTHDVFLTPAAFTAAFDHIHTQPLEMRAIATSAGRRNYTDLLWWISFATLNGCPATVAPIGQTGGGLPVGIQIIGPFLEDATPITFAGLLSDVVGGFEAPPGY